MSVYRATGRPGWMDSGRAGRRVRPQRPSLRRAGASASAGSLPVARMPALAAILLGIGLLGCLGRSPEVSHFVLAAEGPGRVGEAGATEVAVLIGPVRLPAYLDRPQLARLRSDGAIELDEYTRWLGGFEENFLRAVAFEVARRTGSMRIVTHPSKAPFAFDARVRLHVDDLVVVDGRVLRVRVRWSLVGAAEDGGAELHVMEEDRPLVDGSDAAIVAAHDEALAELGRRIADAVSARARGERVGGAAGGEAAR